MFKILARGTCRQSEVGRGVWEQLPMLGALSGMGQGRGSSSSPGSGCPRCKHGLSMPCPTPCWYPLDGKCHGVPGVLWGWGDAPAALTPSSGCAGVGSWGCRGWGGLCRVLDLLSLLENIPVSHWELGVGVPVQPHEQGGTGGFLCSEPCSPAALELMLYLSCALTSLCFHACLLSLLLLNY